MAIDTATMKEALAAAYAGKATYASLHTADPAGTGASEVTGGSPAYARQAVTWNAGGTDGSYTSNSMTFDVPANTSITHVGFWDAATAGNYLDKASFAVTFSAQGTCTVTVTYTQS